MKGKMSLITIVSDLQLNNLRVHLFAITVSLAPLQLFILFKFFRVLVSKVY